MKMKVINGSHFLLIYTFEKEVGEKEILCECGLNATIKRRNRTNTYSGKEKSTK